VQQGLHETQHLFPATDYIVNNWKGFTFWTIEEAQKKLPRTYLIHGKHAVKAQCSYLNCSRSVYGLMSKIGG
jgi:hypothetical protein